MSELPRGWIEADLADLAVLNPGRAANVPLDAKISFVPMSAVSDVKGEIVSPTVRPFSEVSKGYTQFQDGDVIFAKITPCMENGKIAVARSLRNGFACGSTEFHVIRPLADISSDYIWRFLCQKSFRKDAEASMTGAVGQRRVPLDYLKQSRIPLPPLPEQRRIVAKIDSLTAKSARARDNLDHIPNLVERYKQAVLTAAFRGDLTREWRHKNGLPIEVRLFDDMPSELSDHFLPSHWRAATIADIAANHDGRRIPVRASDRANRKGPYPYYGASGIIDQIDGFLFEGDFLLIGEDGANLLSRSTPIAFLVSGKFWVNNHAHILEAQDVTSNRWLCCFINMIDLAPYVTGTAQPKLTQAALNRIVVPLPPLQEQNEIIHRITGAFAWIDRISGETISARKLVDHLDQAVLAKAFRGALVPQDPNDEPASVLLERIKAERSATISGQRRNRRQRADPG